MNFDKSVVPYLDGKKFSNGLKIQFLKRGGSGSVDRLLFLEKVADKRNVIHFGCADHIGLIDGKIKENTWLHKILSDKAVCCVGLDIDKSAVDYISNVLGYDNVIHFDLLKDDPVLFLKALKEKFKGLVVRVVITCPNALFYKNITDFAKKRETINTDHRYWFTPYTISKIMCCAGIESEEFHFATSALAKRNLFLRIFYKLFPAFQETIVCVGKL